MVARALFALLTLCTAAQAAPERLSVHEPHAAARDALQSGEHERARELLGEDKGVPPTLITAPGLYGRALEESGERERACALYEADAREHPERSEAALVRLARCRMALGQKKAAIRAFSDVLQGPVLGKDVLVVDEARAALVSLGAESAALAALSSPLLLEAPAASGTLRREALARSLLLLAQKGSAEGKRKALQRLYVELGETAPAAEALKLPEAKSLASHDDRALALRRAEVLTGRHDNAGVFETLSRHQPRASDVSEDACAIRLMTGKAARKLRRYQSARQALDAVAERCSGESQRKARYLTAQVAYYQSASQGLPLLEAFAKAYPDDSYTDDVLFWRAELLERQGKTADAIATYRDLAERFPTGDMREHARFNLAFLLARGGDAAGARAVLDQVARTASDKKVIVKDRALYWRARLQLYPDPMKLVVTADKAAQKEGFAALLAYAKSRPAGFYGHMARLMAEHAAGDVGVSQEQVARELTDAAASSRHALDTDASLPVGSLQSDVRFSLAVQLAAAGYDAEAEQLLDSVDYQALSDTARLALVLVYTQVGALGKAHQVMRFTGHALPGGKPTGGALLPWHLAYPRAYDDAIREATQQVKHVPKTLLMGLAREESAFDADVVSWAGAIGLCQLMPPTAKEEAGLLKLGSPSLEELRKPHLNARLGANHLSRRMTLLKHPLLAIAAYNAGPGNVAKWRTPSAPKPIDAWVESIPVEQTREYVKKVTGSWVVYEVLDGDVGTVQFPLVLP